NDPDQLFFTVSGVRHGYFAFTDDAETAILSFTLQDVSDGRVVFVHDGGEAAPCYKVSVEDGYSADGPYSAAIDFTNVNDAPVLGAEGSPYLDDVHPGRANPGTLVRDLVGRTDYTDADPGDRRGIAVTGATGTSHGRWQYSLDG